jgi:hypothetical protein
VDAARSRLLEESWDLVVHVTELPIRIARRLRQSHRRLVESPVDAVECSSAIGASAGARPTAVTDTACGHD